MYDRDFLTDRKIRRIALATILRSILDASNGDMVALSWFTSTGYGWMQLLDIRFKANLLTAIQTGCVNKGTIKKLLKNLDN